MENKTFFNHKIDKLLVRLRQKGDTIQQCQAAEGGIMTVSTDISKDKKDIV